MHNYINPSVSRKDLINGFLDDGIGGDVQLDAMELYVVLFGEASSLFERLRIFVLGVKEPTVDDVACFGEALSCQSAKACAGASDYCY